LLRLASSTAEKRGFVRTITGRRARLTGRFHSALNRIIQGGAADINKRVLVETYKRRKELGLTMRLTVHDEVCADLHDEANKPAVERVLNTQYFDLKVPILWDAHTGPNWAACK
jgi:DNA polymerase I-like protein with 3'-5' exonuclease and polymerase domains